MTTMIASLAEPTIAINLLFSAVGFGAGLMVGSAFKHQHITTRTRKKGHR